MKLAERTFRRSDYYITSPFGKRINPVTKKDSFHSGVDYGTNREKWKQYALEDGKVLRAGYNAQGYGHYAEIEYPRLGVSLFYGHFDKKYIKAGDIVNEDTIIGLTGTTGMSTGIHLHLGLKINGNYVDPEKYDYKEAQKMDFKIGDYVYALEDIKLYTTINHLESKYILKKDCKAYVRFIKNNEVALADSNTKEYFESAWTGELDKLSKDDPKEEYKKLYEEQLEINKALENKINKAIEDLKG